MKLPQYFAFFLTKEISYSNIDAIISVIKNIKLLQDQYPIEFFKEGAKTVSKNATLTEMGFSPLGIVYLLNTLEEIFNRKIHFIKGELNSVTPLVIADSL